MNNKIIQKFIDGDKTATGLVFEEYKNLLYFIISIYVTNKDDCDDLLNETFIKIMEHRTDLKDPLKIKSFVSTIAKNESLQFLKKKKEIPFDNIDEMYSVDDYINPLLNSFEPLLNNKEIIVTYYRAVFSYSWKEIRAETNIPISTLKLIYSKAKKKLRKAYL